MREMRKEKKGINVGILVETVQINNVLGVKT